MTHVNCESKQGHPYIRAQETRWQSGVRSCIMPGLSKHLVKELNVGTALIMILYYCILTPYFNLKYFESDMGC